METTPNHNSHKKEVSSEDFINVERDFCSSHHNGTHHENGHVDVIDDKLELESSSPIHLTGGVNGDQRVDDFDNKNKITLTSSESCDVENVDGKSVKDRMLLSIDDASCLLFTQTVTSPMLTPSEENIDFLKGLRRESSQATLSDHTNSSNSPKQANILDDGVPISAEETIYENADPIYENVDIVKQTSEETSNLDQSDESQHVVEVQVTESQVVDQCQNGDDSQHIDRCQNGDDQLQNVDQTQQVDQQDNQTSNIVAADETPIPEYQNDDVISEPLQHETVEQYEQQVTTESEEVLSHRSDKVKTLKHHFLNSTNEPVTNLNLEMSNDELDELKSLNIMKQIHKFESTSNNIEQEITTNICSNEVVSFFCF